MLAQLVYISPAHLEEGNSFALVEDEVLVNEGRLSGQAFVTGARLVLQRVLHTIKTNGVNINEWRASNKAGT